MNQAECDLVETHVQGNIHSSKLQREAGVCINSDKARTKESFY